MRHLPWKRGTIGRVGPALGVVLGGALALALLSTLLSGCGGSSAEAERTSPETTTSVNSTPEVHLVKAQRRKLICTVEQPGFVEAYEQTWIYAKVSGFIKQYYVDIGQQVKKGDPIAEIFVPELREDHEQKLAQVDLDREMVKQAEKLVDVAKSKLKTATAQKAEAKANVGRYQADIVRWVSEVRRVAQMVEQNVMDRDVLEETQKQLASSRASYDAALAAVAAREAAEASAEADVAKAEIDVKTAAAQVKVAEADERRIAAMLAYTNVTAPYDGVITVRNANTWDYVQAATGDKSTSQPSPMFVIARDDQVRIFVDVPEDKARYVRAGTKANVRSTAMSGLEIKAVVKRTSWSLVEKTRTLLAEIDLPTKDSDVPAKNVASPVKNADPPSIDDDRLRPGNYVNTQLIIERSGVPMLPNDALVVSGNQTYCYLLRGGKAVKTPVVRGLRDGAWVEVTKMEIDGRWVDVIGGEEVITGALDELTDGQPVKVVAKPGAETKVTSSACPGECHRINASEA